MENPAYKLEDSKLTAPEVEDRKLNTNIGIKNNNRSDFKELMQVFKL